MMSTGELRILSQDVRAKRVAVDAALVKAIESDVDEYRKFLHEPRPQPPPDELAARLPLMGWLIYEASWTAVQQVDTAFESFAPDRRSKSEALFKLIAQLADAARALPWPEFAPRALGAIRALALGESKRDTQTSYDAAWTLHQEARNKYESFKEYHKGKELTDPEMIGLEETFLQLALAETGTACRTGERVIARWVEDRDALDRDVRREGGDRWTQRIYRQVSEGVEVGSLALSVAKRIADDIGLIPIGTVDEHRMAMATAFQNPGIMTARAALLAYALTPELDRLGRNPVGEQTWDDFRQQLLQRFKTAYDAIEGSADEDGNLVSMHPDHERSLVQLRLNLALLVPGETLGSGRDFATCLALQRLDDHAVEELSAWLAANGGDANVIGSATQPSFIRSVVACRALSGVHTGYHEWRTKWFTLDRHAKEEGREQRVLAVLGETWPPGQRV